MAREERLSKRQREMPVSKRQRMTSPKLTSEMPVGDNDRIQAWAEKMLQEGRLTTQQRKNLRKSQFAIPEDRAYPIHDISHARNALARVSQHGTPEEKRRVRAAVARRYPGISQSSRRRS